jgi:hypothetical protein
MYGLPHGNAYGQYASYPGYGAYPTQPGTGIPGQPGATALIPQASAADPSIVQPGQQAWDPSPYYQQASWGGFYSMCSASTALTTSPTSQPFTTPPVDFRFFSLPGRFAWLFCT